MTADWQPLDTLPKEREGHVLIRTRTDPGTTWRWLRYKPSARAAYGAGRWQIATEYGFKNETLPQEGEWRHPEKGRT